MDPQGPAIMNVSGVYNLSEIWPAFQMGAPTTSFGVGTDPMAARNRTQKARKRSEEDECAKPRASASNGNAVSDSIATGACESNRVKPLESQHNSENEAEGKRNLFKAVKETGKVVETPKQDFIHVRARRGQATDSHSLAERARREKISERMRILQDLVPGCNKVIGKALVLDEIINYIQSLQRQVEFLSMKLEAVNARIGLDGYSPKSQFTQQTYEAPSVAYGSQRVSSPDWLHMQIGGGCERNSWQILPSTPEK